MFTDNDLALMRALGTANFGHGVEVTLPSGEVMLGEDIKSIVNAKPTGGEL